MRSNSFLVRENIALAIDLEGPDFALMTVIKLLVDDGYKKNGMISRGHRENMLSPFMTTAGTDIRRNENYDYYTTHLYSNENLNYANVHYTLVPDFDTKNTIDLANLVFDTPNWGNKKMEYPPNLITGPDFDFGFLGPQ